jgi:hypothetical protein
MCARFITGRHIKLENGVWEYPNTETTLLEANLLTIDQYIYIYIYIYKRTQWHLMFNH